MGAIEDAVDAAAQFVGPFIGKGGTPQQGDSHDATELVEKAGHHLQAINDAERAADPNAPYDASLVGVVYGLLDLTTSLGILPHLSLGAAFSQRPRTVLVFPPSAPLNHDSDLLTTTIGILVPILEQNGTGVQPLVSQRVLPDIISALAELSFSPQTSKSSHEAYTSIYEKTVLTTPTSRLLPILTSLLQQEVPSWWRPRLSKELAIIPLRPHGVRHTIEFLCLSYLSKNSEVPQDASGPQTKLPLPIEAIAQASRLLSSIPSGMAQDEWFTKLAPQLLTLLDGSQGKELSRAAGQIIAGGILNKKGTGAPGAIGWELFARPLQDSISPKTTSSSTVRQSTADQVLVSEGLLRTSLRRLATIASSYTHAGLIKRLIGPVFLPLWGLLNHSFSRPSLDREWTELARAILLRYLAISCELQRLENVVEHLFWDGNTSWIYGPGSEGGIEIRSRPNAIDDMSGMENILSRIGNLDDRVNRLVSLLVDADVDDNIPGALFLRSARKWLSPSQGAKPSLTSEPDVDPMSALTNAKLSEALAAKFKDNFARTPQHIIELMGLLLQNFVDEHRAQTRKLAKANEPSRTNLHNLAGPPSAGNAPAHDPEMEALGSFALSILNTLIISPHFKRTPETSALFDSILPSLQYLSEPNHVPAIPSLIGSAATNLTQAISPIPESSTSNTDPLAQHRATLKSVLTDLTSSEPPNRAWALSTLRQLIKDHESFPLIDVPSTTQMLLSISIADSESYVYTAAIPVLVDLAARAANPTVRIIVDAFVDADERSLRLKKENEIQEALDFRLRVGEILNSFIAEDSFWISSNTVSIKHSSLKLIVEATLALASRRGQRKQTLLKRDEIAAADRRQQQEGEAAWDGPIPNLLDPDADDASEKTERDALLKVVRGWEEKGIEEDVRIRASALSILGSILGKRLDMLNQATVDAGLQMVLLILMMETTEPKGILRRAAVLVIMDLLRGMSALLDIGKGSVAGMGMKQIKEIEKVLRWVQEADVDGLVRDHAESVMEGIQNWQMRQLYKIKDDGLRLDPDLGLGGNLRGLTVEPLQEDNHAAGRGPIVEEIE